MAHRKYSVNVSTYVHDYKIFNFNHLGWTIFNEIYISESCYTEYIEHPFFLHELTHCEHQK